MFRIILIRVPFFLVGTLLAAVCAAAQEVNYVDLTPVSANSLRQKKFVPDGSCQGGGGGGVAVSVGCPPATYPFKLLLLNLDTSEIRDGGAIIALLRVENTGRDSAVVPWSTDPDEIEPPDGKGRFTFFQADLRANISTGDGVSYVELPVHLYGSEQASRTLQEIRPGEFVELAIKLTLDCKAEDCHGRPLSTGATELSFTWTEWKVHET